MNIFFATSVLSVTFLIEGCKIKLMNDIHMLTWLRSS